MLFTGNANFWAQSLDSPVHSLGWSDLCKLVCEMFEKDQHSMLLRQFFRIKQTEGVLDYIEHFDSIFHQILAHDSKFSTATSQ
jgi:Trp operon repressor